MFVENPKTENALPLPAWATNHRTLRRNFGAMRPVHEKSHAQKFDGLDAPDLNANSSSGSKPTTILMSGARRNRAFAPVTYIETASGPPERVLQRRHLRGELLLRPLL